MRMTPCVRGRIHFSRDRRFWCIWTWVIVVFAVLTLTMTLYSYFNSSLFIFSDNPFLISNKSICGSTDDISLIILIHSAPEHFQFRKAIRQTWANYNNTYHLLTFRRVFLFGKVSSQPLQTDLEKEHGINGDLLQSNFIDSYHNLSLNTLHGLKWVNEHCRNAKVVMKVDDDVIIDMFNVMSRIVSVYTSLRHHVFCNHLGNAKILRDPKSKYFVEENQFEGLNIFPPYCEGKSVIFTSDIVVPILQQAAKTPIFWIEDVYIYGILLNKIPNVIIDKYYFGRDFVRNCASNCVKSDKRCRKIMAELKGTIPEQFGRIWRVYQERSESCLRVMTSYVLRVKTS